MNEVDKRVKAALREGVENSAVLSVLVALLTGKRVEDSDVFLAATSPGRDYRVAAMRLREEAGQSPRVDVAAELRNAADLLDELTAPSRFLVTFCGPSSVGKDVVASEVRSVLRTKNVPLSFLGKYTTRGRRGEGESDGRLLEPSSTYTFFETDEEFSLCDDVYFPYQLYGHQYGFSLRHLCRTDGDSGTLGCILGPLERIAEFSAGVLQVSRRRVISVLLTAPEQELTRRLDRRHSLGPARHGRLGVLMDQAEYVDRNRKTLEKQFDIVIENSNSVPLQESVIRVVEMVSSRVPVA